MHARTNSHVDVICRSSSSYAERPLEVRAGEKRYRVERILAEGRTPDEKWFKVVTTCGQRLTLRYHNSEDAWSVPELTPPDSVEN